MKYAWPDVKVIADNQITACLVLTAIAIYELIFKRYLSFERRGLYVLTVIWF